MPRPLHAEQRTRRRRHSAVESRTRMLTVYDGQRALGFLLPRGRGAFEALDVHDHSLGLFPSQRAAAAALSSPSNEGKAKH
jgi:hypothetical protein